ncbi:Protein of unknown function [Bacillus wiedmannii]|uniref:Uncharacterized protein n=1 Tax=Bacillus wiedmannii TaxID=1890302 RepID=A0A1C4EEN6_9BACI|nr:Protein of unknown function [Bacillus wiedmannii]
MVMTVVVMYF